VVVVAEVWDVKTMRVIQVECRVCGKFPVTGAPT